MAELDDILDSLRWCNPEDLERVQRAARFWKKVEKNPGAKGCWLWTDNLLADGYGQFERYRAHRIAYELTNGPIPAGLFICHRCDVKRCVRPEHLYAGTPKQNTREAVAHDLAVGRRKLSNAQVSWIRQALAAGASQRSLARTYQVHPQTIYRIAHQETHREEVMP